MSEKETSPFKQPEVMVGDMVLYYANPIHKQDAYMGWVCRKPGLNAISILVWSEGTGFVEKQSVRHADDPFWKDNENSAAWHKWGCYELHPQTKALKEVTAMLTQMKVRAAKKEAA